MNKKLMGLFSGLVFLLMLGNAGTTQATILSLEDAETFHLLGFKVETPLTPHDTPPVTSIRTDAVYLDGFNSTLGTLLDVSIKVWSQWELKNTTNAEDWGTLDGEIHAGGRGVSSHVLKAELLRPQGYYPLSQPAVVSVLCLDPDGACSESDSLTGNFLEFISLRYLSLSDFIDTTLIVHLTNQLTASVANCPDLDDACQSIASNDWFGSVVAKYTYDDGLSVSAPEPSSLLLMGIGLAGLGFVRLRKRS